jgi:hypothetical protein
MIPAQLTADRPIPGHLRQFFPIYYRIEGQDGKGERFCYDSSSQRAKTIYRGIEPRTQRGTPLEVTGRFADIGDGQEFWVRWNGRVQKLRRHKTPLPHSYPALADMY